jgi:hypothetical protein
VGFGSGHRLVFDAPRNDEELAFVELDDSIRKVDGQVAAENQEELVLMLMVMPDELTFDLRELYLLAVELSDDPRAPAFRELLKLLREIDLVDLAVAHARPPD